MEMVTDATAARAAGDWRSACAAVKMTVGFDLGEVAARYGTEQARLIEADLAGFAPDFLRLHLPEGGAGTRVVLSRRAEPFHRPGLLRNRRGIPGLALTLPPQPHPEQRLTLRVIDLGRLTGSWYDLPAWTWHADAVDERRWAYGASAERLPWHFTDGQAYPVSGATRDRPRNDRPAEFEALLDAPDPGLLLRAVRAAGFAVEDRLAVPVAHWQATLPLLAAEGRRLAYRYGVFGLWNQGGPVFANTGYGGRLALAVAADGALSIVDEPAHTIRRGPIGFAVRAPQDVALLRWGRLSPDDLHPLAHDALFAGRRQQRPAPEETREEIRVRCGTAWHLVEVIGASLRTPHHDDAELRREALLHGLNGCAAALAGFRTGRRPVPKRIRKVRQDFFARARHGDTASVLADLLAGADPVLRDPDGRSLMHFLAQLDHRRLLPVLLQIGLTVEDRDHLGRTPLHMAAYAGAADVVRALLDAGAQADLPDDRGHTAAVILARARLQQ